MNTATYASVAVLPWSIHRNRTNFTLGSEPELAPPNWLYLSDSFLRLFELTGACNDL